MSRTTKDRFRPTSRRARTVLSAITTPVAFQHDPLDFVRRIAQQGDYVPLRFLNWDALFINEPSGIRHVLHTNHRNYSKNAPLYTSAAALIVGKGLITSEGQLWQRQRRQVGSVFQAKHVASVAPLVIEETRKMLLRWEDDYQPGESFDLAREAERLMLAIAGRALFGADLLDRTKDFEAAFNEAHVILAEYARLPFPPMHWPLPRRQRLRRALATMDAIVYKMIDEARGQHGDDGLLSRLIDAEASSSPTSDRQLRDEVMTLLLAGHETSATTLTWTWYHLGRDASLERLVHEEARSLLAAESTPEDMTVTKSVLEETLRLYPPAWFLMRRAEQEDVIAGHTVRAGTLIFFSPYMLHRHPKLWTAPEDFDPGRFSATRRERIDHWSYLPFSAGPRACVGSNMAMLQMQLVIAAVVEQRKLVLESPLPPRPQALMTLRPAHGVRVIAVPRD